MRQLQLFGITKEIRISLKRIHSVKKDTPAETRSINKRTLEGIRRLIQGSQMEIKAKKLIEAQVIVLINTIVMYIYRGSVGYMLAL